MVAFRNDPVPVGIQALKNSAVGNVQAAVTQGVQHAFFGFLLHQRHVPGIMEIPNAMEIIVAGGPNTLACRQGGVPHVGGQMAGAGVQVAVDDFDGGVAFQLRGHFAGKVIGVAPMGMCQNRDAAVLDDLVDHPLVILQGVIHVVLLDDVLLEGHAAADAQDVMAVGVLPPFDQDTFLVRVGVFNGPVHFLFTGGGVVGNGQESVIHPGGRLGVAAAEIIFRRFFQGMASVGYDGVGVKIAAQPGTVFVIGRNPTHGVRLLI